MFLWYLLCSQLLSELPKHKPMWYMLCGPSESVYEWVALDQSGELDHFIVCEKKEKDPVA